MLSCATYIMLCFVCAFD